MARTQKNKATEHHLGLLKAKLAKFRAELLEPPKKSAKGEGFEVLKAGCGRVVLIGFPSVGKSSLLSSVTGTHSEVASYEFTTLTCIPGVVEYNGARIQLLDLPGIVEGAASGKGRGRQVIAVARTADLVVLVLDACKAEAQKPLLIKELEACGIRLNSQPPDIYIKIQKSGGVKFTATCPLTKMNKHLALQILQENKIHNAEVLIREDCSADQFIDAVMGNCVYVPCLDIINKIDCISMEDIDAFARKQHTVVMSCTFKLNLDYFLYQVWNYLSIIRIYSKRPGESPDLNEPILLKAGSTVKDACDKIHKSLASEIRYAVAWGRSTKHSAQRVGLTHRLMDEDVIQVIK